MAEPNANEQVILPGSSIGIMGGGQLGRMLGVAARQLGYRLVVLDPEPNCPAAAVCDEQIVAAYDDVEAVARFAQAVDVVTYEFENVPHESLASIEVSKPIRPSSFILETTRHRAREKTFLQSIDVPIADFRVCANAEELMRATHDLENRCIAKTAEFGYDGKGQAKLNAESDFQAVWQTLNCPLVTVEQVVDFQLEISVICARGLDGSVTFFGPVENRHRNHILDLTIAPAPIAPTTTQHAIDTARHIAERLDVIGLIAVEMFVVQDKLGQQVLVNELAPRPHNSGHYSIEACITSQFEQHIRAICGLPLGNTNLRQPAVMKNLLGDLWPADANQQPDWQHLLKHDRCKLHLYGKHQARPGRKMGHLTCLCDEDTEVQVEKLNEIERRITVR